MAKLPLLLSSLIFLLMITQSTADILLIQNLCKSSAHVDLCLTTLSSDTLAVSCSDRPCVARVAVENSIRNASNTRGKAKELLDKAPPPELANQLSACLEIYANVMTYLNSALGGLDSKNYGTVADSVASAHRIASGCENGFSNRPSPMSEWNGLFSDVTDVASDIVNSIKSG